MPKPDSVKTYVAASMKHRPAADKHHECVEEDVGDTAPCKFAGQPTAPAHSEENHGKTRDSQTATAHDVAPVKHSRARHHFTMIL